MKKRILISLSIATVVAVVLAIANYKKQQKLSHGPDKVSIRLAWVYDMAEAGIFVAKDKGFYEEEGIDLEIKPGGFGLDPLKLVAAGSDAFGVGGGINLLLAREKGLPVVAIAAEFQETPVGFITRKDSGIGKFTDFKQRKIGIQTGADTDTIYRALLSKFSMKSTDVQEVPIQFDPTPFVSGQIDVLPGYVTNQPITLKNQGIETSVITAESQGLNLYGNVYFVTDETMLKNPDLVKRFLRATKKGWQHAISTPDAAIASIKTRSKDFSDEDLKLIHTAVVPFIQPKDNGGELLEMSDSKWKTTYEALKASGLSKSKIDPRTAYKILSPNP
jgi:ABC-type nitrate/sulfonate/bicarbonate transport system substrate-binding protein